MSIDESFTLQIHTGYKYFYLKQQYEMQESERWINRKYQQLSEYSINTGYIKEFSSLQFRQMINTYHKRIKNNSIAFECQTIE